LFKVLSRADDAIVVVEVTESGGETAGGTKAEGNNHALLGAVLDVKDFNDRAGTLDSKLDNLLINLPGVGGGLLKETSVGNQLKASLIGVSLLGRSLELALVDEVAPERSLR
jgi:hypothetical protein